MTDVFCQLLSCDIVCKTCDIEWNIHKYIYYGWEMHLLVIICFPFDYWRVFAFYFVYDGATIYLTCKIIFLSFCSYIYRSINDWSYMWSSTMFIYRSEMITLTPEDIAVYMHIVYVLPLGNISNTWFGLCISVHISVCKVSSDH